MRHVRTLFGNFVLALYCAVIGCGDPSASALTGADGTLVPPHAQTRTNTHGEAGNASRPPTETAAGGPAIRSAAVGSTAGNPSSDPADGAAMASADPMDAGQVGGATAGAAAGIGASAGSAGSARAGQGGVGGTGGAGVASMDPPVDDEEDTEEDEGED